MVIGALRASVKITHVQQWTDASIYAFVLLEHFWFAEIYPHYRSRGQATRCVGIVWKFLS